MKIIVEHWRWHKNINIAPGLSSWISNYIISGTMLNVGKYIYTKYLLMTSMLIISLNHWMRPHTSNTEKWFKVYEVSLPSEREWNNTYTHIHIFWGIWKYEEVYWWLRFRTYAFRIPQRRSKGNTYYIIKYVMWMTGHGDIPRRRCHVRRYVLTYVTKYEYNVSLRTHFFCTWLSMDTMSYWRHICSLWSIRSCTILSVLL